MRGKYVHLFKRSLAVMLSVSMLLGDCTVGMAAETNYDQTAETTDVSSVEGEITEAGEQQTEETAEVLFELEDLREKDAKQYRMSDGTTMAAAYGMNVHYRDDADEWKEIDNRFLYESADEEEGTAAGFVTAEGESRFRFSTDVSDGNVLEVTQDDYGVGFEYLQNAVGAASETAEEETAEEAEINAPITILKGDILNPEDVPAALQGVSTFADDAEKNVWAEMAEPEATEEEPVLTEKIQAEKAVSSVGYENIMPGVSLQYTAYGDSIKEYILVSQKYDSYQYSFRMNLKNLVPEKQKDGSIRLYDEAGGQTVYEIPAAFMTDGANDYSEAVEMDIVQTEDGAHILTVTADAEWINAPERVFPVQIDPTLSKPISDLTDIRGCYICEGRPTALNVNYGALMVGYDSSGNKRMRTYIQLRNLPALPKESVICASKIYFGVYNFSQVTYPEFNVGVKAVQTPNDFSTNFTWNTRPTVNRRVVDYQTLKASSNGTYVGWDITKLVKEHYGNGNADGDVTSFSLQPVVEDMETNHCANAWLRLTKTSAYPILQIFYRDTKGLEDYYTYRTQSLGSAGTGYVGDYTSQLTVVRDDFTYESTIMPYTISHVYNSAYSSQYFTKSTDNDPAVLHTGDFSTMHCGSGWKLSAQETVFPVGIADVDGTETYLVYNDADGTEHYFRKSSSDATKYEDEDGLNLTVKVNGSDYTMTDKGDNQKYFKNGYLTKITDANGNQIHIVYNGGTYTSNTPGTGGGNRITSIVSLPKNGTAEKIFTLTYNKNNCLEEIIDVSGRRCWYGYDLVDGLYQMVSVYLKNTENAEYPLMIDYRYASENSGLTHAYDREANKGIQYAYEKSPTGYRIRTFCEFVSTYVFGVQTRGAVIKSQAPDLKQTVYTDNGQDRLLNTADDIITTCFFNNSGQTVNISSQDRSGTLLGVTAAAYEKNSGTSKKNNRISASVSGGQSGTNLLKNGGFEKTAGTSAEDWTTVGDGGAYVKIHCCAAEIQVSI